MSEDVSEYCSCCNNVRVTSFFSDAARIGLCFARKDVLGYIYSSMKMKIKNEKEWLDVLINIRGNLEM